MMYRFTGSARTGYFPGIPARDLSAGDVEALTPAQRETVAASGLYEWTEADDAPADAPEEPVAEAPAQDDGSGSADSRLAS